MVKIKLKIERMTCEKCTAKVHDALMAIDGVSSVEVSKNKGLTTVRYEGDIADETFTMAVIDAGFKAKVKHDLFS